MSERKDTQMMSAKDGDETQRQSLSGEIRCGHKFLRRISVSRVWSSNCNSGLIRIRYLRHVPRSDLMTVGRLLPEARRHRRTHKPPYKFDETTIENWRRSSRQCSRTHNYRVLYIERREEQVSCADDAHANGECERVRRAMRLPSIVSQHPHRLVVRQRAAAAHSTQ